MHPLDATDVVRLSQLLGASAEIQLADGCGFRTNPASTAPQHLDLALLGVEAFSQDRLLELRAAIGAAIGTDALDLIDLSQSQPALKRQIIRTARLLFARECSLVGPFEVGVLRASLDSRRSSANLDGVCGRNPVPDPGTDPIV